MLSNTLVINGDGTDMELLREEGLEKMDAFIAVTGNAETNILSCLLAKHLGVKRTIAEVENMDYIHLAEINFPREAIIGGVIRGKNAFIAHGETHIKPYDRVVVFALPGVIRTIGKFFN